MTVDGLIALLEEQYGVELSMLSSGVTILYSDFMDRKKMKVKFGISALIRLMSVVCFSAQYRVWRLLFAHSTRFLRLVLLGTGSQGYDTQGGGGERYEEGKS